MVCLILQRMQVLSGCLLTTTYLLSHVIEFFGQPACQGRTVISNLTTNEARHHKQAMLAMLLNYWSCSAGAAARCSIRSVLEFFFRDLKPVSSSVLQASAGDGIARASPQQHGGDNNAREQADNAGQSQYREDTSPKVSPKPSFSQTLDVGVCRPSILAAAASTPARKLSRAVSFKDVDNRMETENSTNKVPSLLSRVTSANSFRRCIGYVHAHGALSLILYYGSIIH